MNTNYYCYVMVEMWKNTNNQTLILQHQQKITTKLLILFTKSVATPKILRILILG